MTQLIKRGFEILEGGSHNYSQVYRGILELMSRFGYLSIREVRYSFNLSLRAAIRRLSYLEKTKLIERFPSLTTPDSFYCLTNLGRGAVKDYLISDEIHRFRPIDYSLATQRHNRTLTKVYVAMKRIYGKDLLNWIGERTLIFKSGNKVGHHNLYGFFMDVDDVELPIRPSKKGPDFAFHTNGNNPDSKKEIGSISEQSPI